MFSKRGDSLISGKQLILPRIYVQNRRAHNMWPSPNGKDRKLFRCIVGSRAFSGESRDACRWSVDHVMTGD